MVKNIALVEWKRKMCGETLELIDGKTCVRTDHPEQVINVSMMCQGCPYEQVEMRNFSKVYLSINDRHDFQAMSMTDSLERRDRNSNTTFYIPADAKMDGL